jgi:hypothetical protein
VSHLERSELIGDVEFSSLLDEIDANAFTPGSRDEGLMRTQRNERATTDNRGRVSPSINLASASNSEYREDTELNPKPNFPVANFFTILTLSPSLLREVKSSSVNCASLYTSNEGP